MSIDTKRRLCNILGEKHEIKVFGKDTPLENRLLLEYFLENTNGNVSQKNLVDRKDLKTALSYDFYVGVMGNNCKFELDSIVKWLSNKFGNGKSGLEKKPGKEIMFRYNIDLSKQIVMNRYLDLLSNEIKELVGNATDLDDLKALIIIDYLWDSKNEYTEEHMGNALKDKTSIDNKLMEFLKIEHSKEDYSEIKEYLSNIGKVKGKIKELVGQIDTLDKKAEYISDMKSALNKKIDFFMKKKDMPYICKIYDEFSGLIVNLKDEIGDCVKEIIEKEENNFTAKGFKKSDDLDNDLIEVTKRMKDLRKLKKIYSMFDYGDPGMKCTQASHELKKKSKELKGLRTKRKIIEEFSEKVIEENERIELLVGRRLNNKTLENSAETYKIISGLKKEIEELNVNDIKEYKNIIELYSESLTTAKEGKKVLFEKVFFEKIGKIKKELNRFEKCEDYSKIDNVIDRTRILKESHIIIKEFDIENVGENIDKINTEFQKYKNNLEGIIAINNEIKTKINSAENLFVGKRISQYGEEFEELNKIQNDYNELGEINKDKIFTLLLKENKQVREKLVKVLENKRTNANKDAVDIIEVIREEKNEEWKEENFIGWLKQKNITLSKVIDLKQYLLKDINENANNLREELNLNIAYYTPLIENWNKLCEFNKEAKSDFSKIKKWLRGFKPEQYKEIEAIQTKLNKNLSENLDLEEFNEIQLEFGLFKSKVNRINKVIDSYKENTRDYCIGLVHDLNIRFEPSWKIKIDESKITQMQKKIKTVKQALDAIGLDYLLFNQKEESYQKSVNLVNRAKIMSSGLKLNQANLDRYALKIINYAEDNFEIIPGKVNQMLDSMRIRCTNDYNACSKERASKYEEVKQQLNENINIYKETLAQVRFLKEAHAEYSNINLMNLDEENRKLSIEPDKTYNPIKMIGNYFDRKRREKKKGEIQQLMKEESRIVNWWTNIRV